MPRRDHARVTADILIEHGAVLLGQASPRSGRLLPVYPDPRRLVSNPIAMKAIARCLLSEMRDLTFDYVCAVATSGISFAAYSCQEGGLRLSYTHNPAGARSWKLVPCLPSGSHLLILDDASGWGRTKLPAVRALIEQGYAVTDILSVSELGVPPTPWYRKRGIKMHSLVDARTILQRMREMGRISRRHIPTRMELVG